MNAVVREFLNDWCIVHVGDIQIHSHTPRTYRTSFQETARIQAVWEAQ
jgi:hypothetical protein